MSSVINRKHLKDSIEQDDFDDGASVKSKVTLRDLFNYGRWKRPFTLKHFLFMLYIPFGLALFPFRVLLNLSLVIISLLLPKSLGLRFRSLIVYTMGFRVKYKGLENVPKKGDKDAARIIVCNHLSDFDPYPLMHVILDFHILVAAHIRKVPLVGYAYEKFSTIYVDQNKKEKARLDVIDSLEKSDKPLLLYPEGGLTSGKKGLMMFHKFVFGLGYSVVPVAMRINNPWPTEIDYLGSSWFKNFFWWLLVPYHNFELTFLPKETIKPNETDSEFASRVQSIIANNLNIEATNLTYSQKKEYFTSGKYKELGQ